MIKTPTTRKNKELGVLMLLLTADTVADVCTTLSNNGSPLPKDLSNPLATELLATRGRDIKLLNNKVSQSYSTDGSSSDGDTDSVGTPVPESNDDLVSDLGSVRWTGRLDDAVLDRIMAFADWRTAVRARQVSRAWFSASLNAAVVCRLPHTKTPAVFIPCRMQMESLVKRDEALLCSESLLPSPLSGTAHREWRCTHCHAQGLSGRYCDSCGSPGPHPATRIFLGQLRRDATVPMVRWFVEEVCGVPQGALLRVENHQNRATGRGKGCAWAYVDSNGNHTQRILSYHHRAFYDVVGETEGMWIAHPDYCAELTEDAAVRGAALDRPRFMPRTAMVVELPTRPAPSLGRVPAYAPPPSYGDFTNDTLLSWLPLPFSPMEMCWDYAGGVARRHNPYATLATTM